MPNAAVLGGSTFCPMVTPGTPPVPHTGGTIIMGAPTVMICGRPAAQVGSNVLCRGVPPHPDVIIKGSMTVMICGRPAAFMSSNTSCGGMVLDGAPTVQIGM